MLTTPTSSRKPVIRTILPMSALQWCASRRNPFGVIPTIVYQMAKVGSSSVVAALQAARIPVFHVHRMDARHLTSMREERRALGWRVPPVPGHDRLGLRLRRNVIDRGGRASIVTLVRDPIARNLSSYFEHLDAIWRRDNAHESVSIESLVDGFRHRFTHAEPLTWFDEEMFRVTGIDVYRWPFPSSGHLVIRHEKLDVLILKSELSDVMKAEVLSSFLERPVQAVKRINGTFEKSKGAAYLAFVNELRLDSHYVQKMLESRYARHFYTPDEREAMWRKYGG